MRSFITGLTLFAATGIAVAVLPAVTTVASTPAPDVPDTVEFNNDPVLSSAPVIDAVFVLDTTSSMSGLIETAKEKIWAIASTMASAQQSPQIRIGLVAFRDRGDQYVTRTIDLSEDLDSVYADLMDFSAQGGGDGPEAVNQGLSEAINSVSWSKNQSAYKTIFLVGDAPPKMNYSNDVKYTESIAEARTRGIIVNTIQCGTDRQTTKFWKHMAQLGDGKFFQVEQGGGSVQVSTPFDADLARLSAELDDTRLYFGNAEVKTRMERKSAAVKKLQTEASVTSQARRSIFNMTSSGRKNRLGDNELVDAVSSGALALEEIAETELPESLQSMDSDDRKRTISRLNSQRESLSKQIRNLTEKRKAYISDTITTATKKDSLEQKLFDAIRDQGKDSGLTYDSGPAY